MNNIEELEEILDQFLLDNPRAIPMQIAIDSALKGKSQMERLLLLASMIRDNNNKLISELIKLRDIDK